MRVEDLYQRFGTGPASLKQAACSVMTWVCIKLDGRFGTQQAPSALATYLCHVLWVVSIILIGYTEFELLNRSSMKMLG